MRNDIEKHLMLWTLTVALVALAVPALAQQDEGEWGDAPEGALAYSISGVIGNFPTCATVGPSAFIYHGPLGWAYFGPMVDFEFDGNAGLCPGFNPYDLDECFADGDAGLLLPSAYTIVGGMEVPCTGPGGPLGNICTMANWGANVDIHVVNNMPVVGYANVLMDWNQDGLWGGSNQNGCNAPEHVLVNHPVPMGFVGPLSGLMPPPFLIGGNMGFVWTRFSITEQPVMQNWDGSGVFEDGETEDYLLYVDDPVATDQQSWSTLKDIYR